MDSFADQVRTILAQRQAERVVLDLRSNPGGDSSVINPLTAVLRAWKGTPNPDSIEILITASTFSSAIVNTLQLRDTTGAEVLGEQRATTRTPSARWRCNAAVRWTRAVLLDQALHTDFGSVESPIAGPHGALGVERLPRRH